MHNREKGNAGEDMASAYLQKMGCTILARNYRARGCEIDIIAREGETVLFCEVKARRTAAFGLGREAVTPEKQRRILQAAQAYLQEMEGPEPFCRFDVLEVDLTLLRVIWLKDAFIVD